MDTIKKWIYEDNSDKMRKEAEMLISIIIFVIVVPPLHFIGTYLAYGFVIANNPGYDLSTGCPIGKPNCFQRMLCYQNNLGSCHGISILSMWIVPLLILGIYFVGVYSYRYIQIWKTKLAQSNDIELGGQIVSKQIT